ncbi:MAG: cell division topological specificity factor MinE [Gammaproteobacteria bacterium]
MNLINFLRKRKPSASIAKERLQIIISHERAQRNNPDFLPQLQKEIVDVIAKYIAIDKDQVKVNLDHAGDHAVLELNVMMPEEAL